MRSLKRSMMRYEGRRAGVKPSRYVHAAWERLQVERVGYALRKVNVCHGSKPKRTWAKRTVGV